jgi:hypothetical protein
MVTYFGPGPVSLIDRLSVLARQCLAPAIRRVANESIGRRCEMTLCSKPNTKAESAKGARRKRSIVVPERSRIRKLALFSTRREATGESCRNIR